MNINELVQKVIQEAKLSDSLIHGVDHWQRVERNGVYLCQFNQADQLVVQLFSLFHDCKRENDHRDLEHGPRAETYLRGIKNLIPVTSSQFEDLCIACRTHTIGGTPGNITIATCWDADRMDIGRAGIVPHEDFMTNDEAKRITRLDKYETLSEFEYKGIFSVE
jgi:uncharacterized protein